MAEVSMKFLGNEDADKQMAEAIAAEELHRINIDSMEVVDIGEQSPLQQLDDKYNAISTCYCGAPRKLGTVELMCGGCNGWFHSQCTSANIGKCLPFMVCYQFYCKNCGQNGAESFTKKQASFSQVCHQAIANLTFTSQQEGESRPDFSKDMDIIPFIEKNWDNMTTMNRRTKQTWHKTILNTMLKEPDAYMSRIKENEVYFTLLHQNLYQIAPVYDARPGIAGAQLTAEISTSGKRGPKRKAPVEIAPVYTKKKSDCVMGNKLPFHGYPLEHPFNKDGYRYYLAECDPHAPNRQAFDDSTEMAGKPIPGYLYRVFKGNQVLLSMHDRATQLKLSDDRLTVTGEKGYSMIRASHGVISGMWYFEVTVDSMPEGSAGRIGWSQSLGNLQAPCGYDSFSYSWRTRNGTAFHQSKGHHFCSDSLCEGDVLGFLIYLPLPNDTRNWLPDTYKDRPLVKFKSHLYFEEKDCVMDAEKTLHPSVSSKMSMYRNGQNIGIAFPDIYEGIYFPSISLYKNITVTANFGPAFKHPPVDVSRYKPMSEAADQAVVEGTLADLLYHIENESSRPEF